MGRFYGDLPDRAFNFAKLILGLADQLPNGVKGWVVAKQLLRSGTSIGANLQEADQAFTEADFAHKCSIALKEASETLYWLRLCRETNLLVGESALQAISEADELIRILVSIVKKTQAAQK